MNHQAFDLESAANVMEGVVSGISDTQLDSPTPCADVSVRDLLTHVLGLTEAFRQAATKEAVGRSQPPGELAVEFGDWHNRISAQLKSLVEAWCEPAAWTGDTEAGGVLLPAPEMATVALNELVVHAWDLARATS
ncbi:TIGR03086 family metal-binding protein [Nocardia crassostreae]|uniref:TIGR03086 family metal-binding protein n=1 Tax=Nocardia crassostreae TaxID=53428 RepID=UPI000A52659E|nr:TIGR03086 family metal-binding protein [Nocardia crassostreae]